MLRLLSLLVLAALLFGGWWIATDAERQRQRTVSLAERELAGHTAAAGRLRLPAGDRAEDGSVTLAASDAWGRPLRAEIDNALFGQTLRIRSAGPDGLLLNDDDIVASEYRKSESVAEAVGGAVYDAGRETARRAAGDVKDAVGKRVDELGRRFGK